MSTQCNPAASSVGTRRTVDALKDFGFRHKYRIISVVSVVALILFWEVGSVLHWFNPKFIPSIASVWAAFTNVLSNGYNSYSLWFHLWSSMRRLLIAIAMAFVLAVPLGLLAGANKVIHAILDPFVEFYRALPPLAYYTLLVLWLGIENESKITLLFLACFAPIYIACVAAVMKVPAGYINAAATLGARKRQIFTKVIFPYCLPDIFTGIRTAMGVGYSTLVAAEMVAAVSGIGWMVLDASNWLRSDIIFAGIIVMGVTGILIDAILRAIEKAAVPWKGKS